MTKTKLLCVSLLLIFGLGLSVQGAFAQNYFTFSTEYAPRQLRPNSNAEALTPLVLTYVSSGPATPVAGNVDNTQSFSVLLNAPIVGFSGVAIAPVADFCTSIVGGVATLTGTLACSELTVTATPNALVLTNNTGTTLTWTAGYFYIYGIRVNTFGLAANLPITATVLTSVPVPADQWTVEGPASQVVGIVSATTALTTTVPAYEPLDAYSCLGISPAATISTTALENWAGAWTSLADEEVLAPYAPSATGTVTNGSDITIVVGGIPAGVTIVPQAPINIFVNGVLGTQTWAPVSPPYVSTAANSTATFTFIITATNRPTSTTIEGATFSFLVSSTPLTTVDNPPTTTSVELSPAPSGTSYYPAFSYPVFGNLEELPGTPADAIVWLDCQTTLFYPYVTNYYTGPSGGPLGNWDTAIEVANMSSVPANSEYSIFGFTIPTNGACTFSLYSAGTATTAGTATLATPVTSWTTPVVLSGGIWSTLLSAKAPGFGGGYAIAVCDFLTGQGYAELVDNANGLGNWQVMAGYAPYWFDPTPKTNKVAK